MVNLKDIHKIYFVGIGGIAMSATAGLAKARGFTVSGSDSKDVYTPAKDVLEKEGISFFTPYNLENAKNSAAEMFVLSAGEDLNNPEVKYIVDNNLPRMSLSELLYELNKDLLRVVVAGTNGKSTTTALLGHVLRNIDDSSFLAGAVLQNYDSNFYQGNGHYFVVEGDEYKSQFDDPTPKFHYYKPDVLLLTNLEWDHPDIFESLDAVVAEFTELIDKMPEDGLIIYNADDEHLPKLAHNTNLATVSFGIDNEADFKVEQIKFDPGFTTIEIFNKLSKNVSSALLGQTEQYKLQLPGKMNVYNALAVIATLRTLGFSQEQIALEVLSFQGTKRRFEILGQKNGITLVDDYAHHPTAIRETLAAAKIRYPKSKIWAVFEPHTFSRTEAVLPDLAKAFAQADEVLISEIYPAREKASEHTIKSEAVALAVGLQNKNTRLVRSKQEALDILTAKTHPGDVVIIMAVGSFNRLAYELKNIL